MIPCHEQLQLVRSSYCIYLILCFSAHGRTIHPSPEWHIYLYILQLSVLEALPVCRQGVLNVLAALGIAVRFRLTREHHCATGQKGSRSVAGLWSSASNRERLYYDTWLQPVGTSGGTDQNYATLILYVPG